MELRILQKKVLFLHHLEHLEDGALAKARFGLQDMHSFTKMQFERVVKQKIKILNKERIVELVKKKKYQKNQK